MCKRAPLDTIEALSTQGVSRMTAENNRAEEARAMERIVNATRAVQAAFLSLQKQFPPEGDGRPGQIALQTFDAALQELEDAQAAFDTMLNDLFDGAR
jgi:hypothetical protein